jgi:manganese/zinc/iron transport system permease protein
MLEAYLNNIGLVIMSIGALVGVAASLLGTFLVLRRSSMLSDAISHSILLGIVLVFLITGEVNSPFQIVGAALAGVLTVFLTELLTSTGRVKSDAAIGLVFPALFAIAVILINLYARNVHLDVHAVLLGEIAFAWLDTVNVGPYAVPRSLLTMGIITLVNFAFVVFFYKELKLATFDEALAQALGFSPVFLYYALLTLTSVTAVGAFDAVGAILLIAFVIVPPAAAYLLTDRLWRMMLYGALIAVASSVSGYYLARYFNVSIGGMMASMTGVFLLLAFIFSPRYGLITQELRRAGQRRDNAERMLLVHLYNHEGDRAQARENAQPALESHLRWDAAKAEATLRRGLERGLIRREGQGGMLYLTEAGRALAQEVLEPWTATR